MSFFLDKSKIPSCHLWCYIEILKNQICFISESEQTIFIILLFLGKITSLMVYIWGNNNAILPLLVYDVIWLTPSTVESIKDLEAWMKLPTSRCSSSRTSISSDIHYHGVTKHQQITYEDANTLFSEPTVS